MTNTLELSVQTAATPLEVSFELGGLKQGSIISFVDFRNGKSTCWIVTEHISPQHIRVFDPVSKNNDLTSFKLKLGPCGKKTYLNGVTLVFSAGRVPYRKRTFVAE